MNSSKEVNQKNIFGKNEINNQIIYCISVDVERLQEIIRDDANNVQKLLSDLTDNKRETNKTDNSFTELNDKNLKNDLQDFYDEWIKKEESKFAIIEQFIRDNDLYDKIDNASVNLKQIIYSYQNKNNHKLTSELFTTLIQEHTKGLDGDDKDIIKLLLYFLYRECFIGDK